MIRFLSFTSGSCGNAAYLGYGDGETEHGILLDAAVSPRTLRGYPDFRPEAVLITHDHGDHIRSIGSLCKKLTLPVWATTAVQDALLRHPASREYLIPCRRDFNLSGENEVAPGFRVRAFVVPHDATETVGFRIMLPDGHKFVLMTDLGFVTGEAMAYAREADTLVIESNYDEEMLLGGNYPPELKRRIAGGAHLSNAACAEAIRECWHPGLRNLFLCHLSGNNNTPELALASARNALASIGVAPGAVNLRVLPRGIATPLLNL